MTSIVAHVFTYVFFGGLLAAGMTMTIIRFVRSTKSRERQMARVAGLLDGRRQVYIGKMELSLALEDLARVAYSRGYSVIDHRFGKYYEFVYTPYQPGRVA
ncbi:hypothetical protein SAMN05421837_104440 [Amycolatopsis pretoriensis]|uniref:Uncharacterized protein n=1 Tax=Amycolatopsis pretoriensis TaxID=218821 RepID=A0A1H5QS80_9PSEU|nr:hypothetical protein [Amycolatopsis pretoriensis]SEF28970.1 hypothetical protein SAMN05421837_104440 [Amycolatopsis pretoriensis]